MPRPKKKAGRPDRRRINLSFDLNEKNEALAYEVLRRLSQSRQATQFVVALMLAQGSSVGPQIPQGMQTGQAVPKSSQDVSMIPAAQNANLRPEPKLAADDSAPNNGLSQAADEQTIASIFDIFGG